MLLQLMFNRLFLSISVAVLDITSETGCHNSTNNSTYISISCTVSYCGLPNILLNGKNTFITIDHESEIVTKTCMNGSGMIATCDDYLKCPETPDPTINITVQKQGFIPADKLTSCMYTVACKSSEPNCTQKTEKAYLLKECDIMPVPECSVPSTTVTKVVFNTTTVTMATTVTSSILDVLPCSCSKLLTSDDIEPTCDCTSCYDIISTSTVSLIPTSISCNMPSQLTHTTTSIIFTTITSTTYSMCSSNIPALSPETTYPTISLSQSGKFILNTIITNTLYTSSIIIVPVTFTYHDQ